MKSYEVIILYIYIAYLLIMSLISFTLFYLDKENARKNYQRFKEKTLLGLTIYGGAVGSFIGRIVAHHKTNKSYFSFIIYLSMTLQLFVLAVMLIVCL